MGRRLRTRLRRGSRVARARFAGEPVNLVEPLTFMNRSGDALGAVPGGNA